MTNRRDNTPASELLAVVGLAGAGKSTAVRLLSDFLRTPVTYLGGVVVSEVQRRGLPVNEENEKTVREELRSSYGMGAIATLAADDILRRYRPDDIVLIDGLYSYDEKAILASRTKRSVFILAIHAARSQRERRLATRAVRPLTPAEIEQRDLREVRTLDKATPIALADDHIVNNGTTEELEDQLLQFLERHHVKLAEGAKR